MRKIITLILLFYSLLITPTHAQTANWSAVKPALFPTNVSGQIHGISRVSQMKFHPTNSSKMYAVSARGGLFISSDGGTNWSLAAGCDNIPFAAFASVCIDFTNDQILYLGAGDHNYYYTWGGATGVWKSTNGGQTFTQTTLNNKIIVDMVMDPADHNSIVAVTNGGIYKTINAGSTWTLKSTSRAYDDIKQKTPSSRTLYAATTDSAFFRSSDFGDTWSQITSGIILPAGITNGNGCRIALTPADTNIVYLGMVANSGLIYKSTNGGTSFTAVKTTVPPYLTYYNNDPTSSGQGDYNFGIGVDRIDPNILYLVAHNVWKSTDGGANWSQLTNWWAKVHTDMHQIITSPYNNSQLWDMNDGGVWLSTDGGNNWSAKSDGIYGYEIYHGNCSPTRKDMISIGTQDNGELYSTTAGWFTNRGGDWSSECAFDYRSNSSTVYYYENNKRRSVTGGDQTYGLPAAVTILQDIAFHRSNPNLAFVGDTSIYRTTNLTVTTPAWTSIVNLNKKIMAMHCNYADANKLYAITSDGLIYVSTNALSATPTFTSYVLPNSTNNAAGITTIKASPNTVYITCNTKVYRSTDNGANWTNITYNLPSVNHVQIIADEFFSTNEMVFIASNNTVYYKLANALSWTIYNLNLPSRTSIVDMSIFNDSTSNTVLRVSTYGRGMWETPISNLRSVNANFATNDTNPCPGATVQFSDLSTGNILTRSWVFPGGTPATSNAINPTVVYNSAGAYTVTLTVSDGLNTSSISKTNYINIQAGNLPLAEGFEGVTDPPNGWKNLDNGTGGYAWSKTSDAGGFGTSANSMMFNNYSWNVSGEKDELVLPRLQFTGYNNISLTFDVAYQVYPGYVDSLLVLLSTDCGNTYTPIYANGGLALSTAGSASSIFIPTAAQWRTETINLTSYAGLDNVVIAFQNVNGYGNKLYLDNININATVDANAGTDKNICSGNTVALGMNSVNGINYSWTPSTGLSSSTVSNPNASPIITTTYILTATQTNSGILNSDTVIVNVSPSVVTSVSIVASPVGSICAGTNVTFTATSFNGGSPSYQWKKNGINVGTNSSTYANNSLAQSDQILCVLTGNAACSSGSPATSNTISMSVSTSVTPSVSMLANPAGPICSGTSVTFTANPVNGGTTPTYVWKKNGITVGTNSATYTDNALLNTNQIYCIMNSNAFCPTPASVNSNTITMIVNTNVTASASILASPSGSICQGTNVTFTATAINGGSPTYQWKKNSINVGTNSSTFSDNTLINSDQILCEIISTANCVSGSPALSNIIIASVNPSGTAGISIAASPSNVICQGSNVTFTATPVNGGTPAYQWKKNNINVGTNSPSYVNNTLVTSDQITCTMTSNTPCVSGSPAVSNTVVMTVNSNVTAGVSIVASPAGAICQGTNVVFTATPVNGGTPTYQWKKNGSNVGTNSAVYSNNALNTSDQIICQMTSSASCVSGSPATSNTLTMTVSPNVTPSISITANPAGAICLGTNVTFTATPVNGGTPVYHWKKNGVNVGTNSPVYSDNSLINGNQISCVMGSNASCATLTSVTSNSITQIVNPNVIATVSISSNPNGPICNGNTVLFTATPVNGGSPSYQWKKNGINTGSNSNSFSDNTLNSSDQVTCVMTSSASCVSGSPATSNTLMIVVNPNVQPTITISVLEDTICGGNNVTFTAQTINSGSSPSYQWKNGLTNTGTNNINYSTSTLTDGNVISCIMTSNAMCLASNTAVSNAITETVISPPIISSFSPSTGAAGTSVVIDGINFLFVSSVLFNGNAASFIVNSPTQITATVPVSATSGFISIETSCGNSSSSILFTVPGGTGTVNIHALIEGYYIGSGLMNGAVSPTVSDTFTLELHQPVTPFSKVVSIKSVADISGYSNFNIPGIFTGSQYYLVVKQRNSLETWSAFPVLLNSGTTTYDFTTNANKAYGNNLKNLQDGRWGFYSGDLSDAILGRGIQDGVIESQDYGDMESALAITLTGYVPEDITGDGVVESSDYSIIEGNVYYTLVMMRP